MKKVRWGWGGGMTRIDRSIQNSVNEQCDVEKMGKKMIKFRGDVLEDRRKETGESIG